MIEERVKISIALATYNGSRYLPELLASLTSQNDLPYELVVSDDNSTDTTPQIIAGFAEHAPFPVRLHVNEENIGYPDNFLATANRCRGNVVAFCDQDDIWHSNKIELVSATFEKNQEAVLVCHYARVVDKDGNWLGRKFPRDDRAESYRPPLLPLTFFPGFTLSVRKSLLAAADPAVRPDGGHWQPGPLAHDAWLWMIASCVGDVTVLPDQLVSWRQHDNLFGDSHVRSMEKFRRMLSADADLCERQARYWHGLAVYLEAAANAWRRSGRPEWASHALARAERHEARARKAERRAGIYAARTRRRSVAQWLRLYSSPWAWDAEVTRSRWGPAKDLVAALAPSARVQSDVRR